MRRVWSWSPCVALLLCSLIGRGAMASHAGRRQADVIHRLEKAQITARPERRDVSVCQNGYSLCPMSVSGGCCPSGYDCATDSCYATTAGPSSACGQSGYYGCGADVGGGCCPSGYICGAQDCTPPPGATNTYTSCPTGYNLCPATYNYGCCPSSMGCGISLCYATNPTTYVYTQTITTATGTDTVTSTSTVTTVMTATIPSGLSNTEPSYVAKVTPTAVAKGSAISSPTNNAGGGIPSSTVHGIIGGAVGFLVVVVVATSIIVWRFNHVARAIHASRNESSSTRTKSHTTKEMVETGARLDRPGPDADAMSVEPLMTSTANSSSSVGSTPQPRGPHGRSNSDAPSSSTSSDIILGAGSDSAGGRSAAGYFDIRSSVEGQGTQYQQYYPHQQHWRQLSDASELSDTSANHAATVVGATSVSPNIGSPPIPIELVADGAYLPELDARSGRSGRSPTDSSPMLSSARPSSIYLWRHSDASYRPNSWRDEGAGPVGFAGAPPLDVVNEGAEISIHEYYGPGGDEAGERNAGPTPPPGTEEF